MRKFFIICLSVILILAGCERNEPFAEPLREPSPGIEEKTPSENEAPSENGAPSKNEAPSENETPSENEALSEDETSPENGASQSLGEPAAETENTELTAAVSSIIDNIIAPSMSEYEKVKAIHDYLVIHVDYDYENLQSGTLPDDVFTAEGALLNHSAVCQGYAEAFVLLCGQAGLESSSVYGYVVTEEGEESHAWNQVRIDGLWYNMDVTWDDPLLNDQNMTDGSNMIYDYFLVPDSALENNHFPDHPEELHKCISSIYMEGNRERSIAPYLEEPYTIVLSDDEALAAVTEYLQSKTLRFQIVYDTVPELAEEKMNLVLEQVKNAMDTSRIYGQIELEAHYGIADYVIISVTVTPQ